MNHEQPGIKKLYYSIGEVSKITGLKPYVLRYWETEFKQLNPPKNRAGNRTYRQKDIDLILQIKDLLYNKKYTIEGARNRIQSKTPVQDQDMETVAKKAEPSEIQDGHSDRFRQILQKVKQELQSILDIIDE
ncbi:MAG: MerR family transcriptional regulator [FCB group bacterium]|nr:MerR family transcriptional regulator [FCB group bacterium]